MDPALPQTKHTDAASMRSSDNSQSMATPPGVASISVHLLALHAVCTKGLHCSVLHKCSAQYLSFEYSAKNIE